MAKRRKTRRFEGVDQAASVFSAIYLALFLCMSAMNFIAGTTFPHTASCCGSFFLPTIVVTTSAISILALSDHFRNGGPLFLFILGVIGNLCLLVSLCGEPCYSPSHVQVNSSENGFYSLIWSRWLCFSFSLVGALLLMGVHLKNQSILAKKCPHRPPLFLNRPASQKRGTRLRSFLIHFYQSVRTCLKSC